MIMAPMPRESEKNICPPAEEMTAMKSSLSGCRFGTSMKRRPSPAPGRVTERMMTTSSITKSAGMAYFVNFSMPPEMPPMTMMQVSARKMTL